MDISDDSVYIQELKKVFDYACCAGSSNSLGVSELEVLCQNLQLGEHSEYIISHLLPSNLSTIDFPTFKDKFLQILPEVVEYSSAENSVLSHSLKSHDNSDASPSRKQLQSINAQHGTDLCSNDEGNNKSDCVNDDDNTSRDILSDEIDGEVPSTSVAISNSALFSQPVPKSLKKKMSTSNSLRKSSLFLDAHETFEASGAGQPHMKNGEINNGFIAAAAQQRLTLLQDIKRAVSDLGLAEDGYVGRYELKILCQSIGLKDLSAEELQQLFAHLDTNSDGRISLQELYAGLAFSATISSPVETTTAQTTIQQSRLQPPSEFDQHSFLPVEQIDLDSISMAKVADVMECLQQLGIRNSTAFLETLQLDKDNNVNVKSLVRTLNSDDLPDTEKLTVALVIYKAQLLHVMNLLEQCEGRSEHYFQELQQIQARNKLLVEELDQSQITLERNAENKIRCAEERFKASQLSLEGKWREERELWTQYASEFEDMTNQLRKREQLLLNRITQLEQENELLSIQLKERAKGPFSKHEQNHVFVCPSARHSVEKKQQSTEGDLQTSANRECPSRRLPIMKRKGVDDKESSDFESEVEPASAFFRIRVRRPLTKKQRRERSNQRTQKFKITPTSSDDAESLQRSPFLVTLARAFSRNNCHQFAVSKQLMHLEEKFAEERKQLEHHYKVQMSSMEDSFARTLENEGQLLILSAERQKAELLKTHTEKMQNALLEQERELMEKHEMEIRELQIRWTSEKNVLERAFAEEKMSIMSKLQEDFETELKRVCSTTSRDTTKSDAELLQLADLNARVLAELELLRNEYDALTQERDNLKQALDEIKSNDALKCATLIGQLEDQCTRLEKAATAAERGCGSVSLRNARSAIAHKGATALSTFTICHVSVIQFSPVPKSDASTLTKPALVGNSPVKSNSASSMEYFSASSMPLSVKYKELEAAAVGLGKSVGANTEFQIQNGAGGNSNSKNQHQVFPLAENYNRFLQQKGGKILANGNNVRSSSLDFRTPLSPLNSPRQQQQMHFSSVGCDARSFEVALGLQLIYLEKENLYLCARLADAENLAPLHAEKIREHISSNTRSCDLLMHLYAENVELFRLLRTGGGDKKAWDRVRVSLKDLWGLIRR